MLLFLHFHIHLYKR